MTKTNDILGVRVGFVFLFLVFSLLLLSSTSIVFGQGTSTTEICNGLDDNGDGVIDEGVNCDHYLSYLVDKSINPVSVVLSDQFISPTDFQLTLIERLLNPVRKIHAGKIFNPKRPNLHYLAYQLQSSATFFPRSVLIENQFEKRNILVTKPHYLLSPTGKRKIGIPVDRIPEHAADRLLEKIVPPIPQNANHYLCYDVEPYTITKGVSLRDQFQQKQFEVLRARYLCNPAEKIHAEKVNQIVDENNHLMCYEVIPHNLLNRQVLTHDQFGVKSLKAVRTEEICVPTVKTLLHASCATPDDQETAVLLDLNTKYKNTDGQLVIVQPTPVGGGLTADILLHSIPTTAITRNGTPELGEAYVFETEMLQLTLQGTGHVVNIPVSGEIKSSPRTPGDPVQSFDMDMPKLQGQLPIGDPDFDLLRITAGNDFGLPSPGHTTLTAQPDGTWAIDSFFDITYRIDFEGAQDGSLAGQHGSTTGTIRLKNTCP